MKLNVLRLKLEQVILIMHVQCLIAPIKSFFQFMCTFCWLVSFICSCYVIELGLRCRLANCFPSIYYVFCFNNIGFFYLPIVIVLSFPLLWISITYDLKMTRKKTKKVHHRCQWKNSFYRQMWFVNKSVHFERKIINVFTPMRQILCKS